MGAGRDLRLRDAGERGPGGVTQSIRYRPAASALRNGCECRAREPRGARLASGMVRPGFPRVSVAP